MYINLMPMNLKRCTFPYCLVAIVLLFSSTGLLAQTLQYDRKTSSCTFDTTADIHIQALKDAIADDAVVNITSPDAWLFFDNIKPNEVATRYAAHIQIDDKTLVSGTNARVVLHRQGAIVIPHAGDYAPLKVYSESGFEGEEASYRCNYYYSDLAVTTGTGLLGDKEIRVGRAPDYAVTDNLDGGYTIGFGTSYASLPHVLGAMQTMNDTITSTQRTKSRLVSSATIIKDREKSASHSRLTPEQEGWIVIGHTHTSPVLNLSNQDRLFDEPIHESSGKAVYVNNTEKHSVYIVGGNRKGIKLLKK